LVGYTSGTGLAGFYGAGITLLLTIYHFKDYQIFLSNIIIPFIYCICFFILNKRKVSIIS